MDWESSDVVRFNFGPPFPGQTMVHWHGIKGFLVLKIKEYTKLPNENIGGLEQNIGVIFRSSI